MDDPKTLPKTQEQIEQETKFSRLFPFKLDKFQIDACESIDRDESVLISAHTSAGKTVVAQYAIDYALQHSQRIIYTSPIKALSNQKFNQLSKQFNDVGLMTGDITINPNALCLIMTTEILRSMLYRGNEIMREVHWVIFDEIHYMTNKERGVVWEETIILLPNTCRLIFLSATIPNAQEFADWISNIKGKQKVNLIYTDFRPVPLQHYTFPTGANDLYLIVDDQGNFREQTFQKAMSILASSNPHNQQHTHKKGKSGPGQSRKKRAHMADPQELSRIIRMIVQKKYSPLIVFSFSRRECETKALASAKDDFTTPPEKATISEVFDNAISLLSEEDQTLRSVLTLKPLLKRGIGIHHSGLLPILKEVTEILFTMGYLKLLFATETFAMGISCSVRTVLFSSLRKFDGEEFRLITPGEYIQMSGRAGRRGEDDNGIIVSMLNEPIEPMIVKNFISGLPDNLTSSFRLSYNMLLNLLRMDGIKPDYMLKSSFHQHQNNVRLPQIQRKISILQEQAEAIKIPDEPAIQTFYNLRTTLSKLKHRISNFIFDPSIILPFLTVGRLVRVVDYSTTNQSLQDWGWGPIINVVNKPGVNISKTHNRKNVVVDVLLECIDTKLGNKRPQPALPQIKAAQRQTASGTVQKNKIRTTFFIVPITLTLVDEISSIILDMPSDLRPHKARQKVGILISKAKSCYPDGFPLLDPIEDLKIVDPEFKNLVEKASFVEERLVSCVSKLKDGGNIQVVDTIEEEEVESNPLKETTPTPTEDTSATKSQNGVSQDTSQEEEEDTSHASTSSPKKPFKPILQSFEIQPIPADIVHSRYEKYVEKVKLFDQINSMRQQFNETESIVLTQELDCMKRVLRRLGYIDLDNIIQTKGRVACEINCVDELVATELMISGVFSDLSPEGTLGLLSCLIAQTKEKTAPMIPQEILGPFAKLQEIARNIAVVSRESNIQVDEEEYVNSFLPTLCNITYEWAKGTSFKEITEMTSLFEGNIIRALRRLEELLRQLSSAAKAIGISELEDKFAKGMSLIKRDIAFAPSLYVN